MPDESIKLTLDLADSTAKAKELDKALEEVGNAAESAATKGDKLTKSSGSSARAMLELSRGVQDFAAAGILGMVNNVEGLALSLGLGAGVAGTATLAIVALQLLTPALKTLGESFSDQGALDEAKALDKLSEEASKLKDRLDELTGAHTARARALAEENQVLERKVKLEEQARENAARAAREETERQVKAKAMEGTPSLEEQRQIPSEKARADELKKIVGGNPEAADIRTAAEAAYAPSAGDQYEAAIQALGREHKRLEGSGIAFAGRKQRDIERQVRALRAAQAAGTSPEEAFGALPPTSRQMASEAQGPGVERGHRDADRLLGQFYAGDADALRRIISLMPEGTLREGMERLTPDAQMRQRMRDIGGTLRNFGRKAMDKAATEGAKRAKAEQDRRKKEAERKAKEAERKAKEAEQQRARAAAERARNKAKQTDAILKGNADRVKEEERRNRESVALSRRIGRAAARPSARIPDGHLPLMAPGPLGPEQLMQMAETQKQLAENQAALMRLQREAAAAAAHAKSVGRQLRRPLANDGWN